MGEGIIGLVKSTSYTIQGTMVSLWQEGLIVAAAVLLIYLMYILYFDNVDHHGFGTIGQQLWTLLHFPLHVAILLTVEGSTALLIWNACRRSVVYVNSLLPSPTYPKGTFSDNKAFVAQVANSWNATMSRFKYKDLNDYYPYANFQTDLSKLSKTNTTFGTSDWSKEVGKTITKMNDYYQYFIYQNFGAEGVYKIKKTSDYGEKVALYEEGYRFVMIYYYISAGALLLILAGLLLFGKKNKTGTNWWSIAIRILAGLSIPIGIISPLMEKSGADNSFRYQFSYLLIPIIAVGYFVVLIVDNIAKAISEKHYTIVEERRLSRISSNDASTATFKKMGAIEEERELTDEESSYELHRNTSLNGTSKEHGSPQFIGDYDRAVLMQHAQPQPTSSGYAQVGQDDQDLPHYRYGDESSRFR